MKHTASTKGVFESYDYCTNYLFGLQRHGVKFSLENIQQLLQFLGHPETSFPSIHIAGTNGKGSTAAIIHSILLAEGYRAGIYTSPHLVDFRERIRIGLAPISKEMVVEFTRRLRPVIEELQPSFFEVATAMSFWYFARERADIVVVETGMGGRLDSTNVLEPLISVITPIDFDHQFYLGNSITEIAGEKAGIIKPFTPCITNNNGSPVLEVLEQKCSEMQSTLYKVQDQARLDNILAHKRGIKFDLAIFDKNYKKLHLNLAGTHQLQNAMLAIGTLELLQNALQVSEKSIRWGLSNVRWAGRLELVREAPDVYLDVSHNPAGFQRTFEFLKRLYPKKAISVIVALQSDKDFKKISQLIAENSDNIWVTQVREGKPLSAELFAREIRLAGRVAKIEHSIDNIIHQIKTASADTVWLVSGSHYLIGEVVRNSNFLDLIES